MVDDTTDPSTSGDDEVEVGDEADDPGDLDALLAKIIDRDEIYSQSEPSYLDAGMMGLNEEPAWPRWLGMRWREIPPELQQEAWVELRRWVDWLIGEFKLTKTVIPACWFRHSEIVAELHAAMNLEYKAWEEGAPTVNPMWMWLPQLQAMTTRLRMVVDELPCKDGHHEESETVSRIYDDDLWEDTVFSRREARTIDRPDEEAVSYVRVRVIDDNGEIVAESGVVGAGAPRHASGSGAAVLRGDGVPGGRDAVLEVMVDQVPAVGDVLWETAESADGPWASLDDDNDEEEPAATVTDGDGGASEDDAVT